METIELPTRVSDKFFRAFCPNPTVIYDLGSLYDEFNSRFFHGELPNLVKTVKVVKGEEVVSYGRLKWDGRLKNRTLGTYTPARIKGQGVIRLSRNIASDPVQVKSTLLHEMLHLYLDLKDLDDGIKGHGSHFMAEAKSINTACEGLGVSYRINFHDNEITQEEASFSCDLLKEQVFRTSDLDIALQVKKVLNSALNSDFNYNQ